MQRRKIMLSGATALLAAVVGAAGAVGAGGASAATSSTTAHSAASTTRGSVVSGSMRAPLVPLYATRGHGTTYVGVDAGTVTPAKATAKFTVTYHNFSAPAKAAFQRAVNYWSTQLTSSVPIQIDATYKALGPGVLGSAGPYNFHTLTGGRAVPNSWYAEALSNDLVGQQIDPNSPDIVANFSSAFNNWYFGTGKAPANTYDFQSVVTHELGHGLGFLGFGNVSQGKGTVQQQGHPTIFDRYTQLSSGKSLLSFPDKSAALKNALTGGQVYFSSSAVKSANNGKPAKLYAPGTWQPGSSYSHLDEATYRAGNRDSLMTPQLGDGETIRTEGPITRAVFSTLGW